MEINFQQISIHARELTNKFLQTKTKYIYTGTYNRRTCLEFGGNTNEFEFQIQIKR